ncbi:MAG TPA: hypothetical protein ENK18_18925 [Deltaproteobacteria bacterium]|nr:hypothetical protein [Deltaproteobacteria bacterium]
MISSRTHSLSMDQALHEVMIQALASDPTVAVLSEQISADGQERHLGRWRITPVADRGTVGLAVGMALGGRRPVVCLSGTSRLPSILAPLSEASAIAQRGEFSVPLVLRIPYGTEAVGLDQPVGRFLTELPGLTVVCASSPGIAAGLLRTALSGQRPVVLLEPRALQGSRGTVGPDAIDFGAQLVRRGQHVTLATWGAGVATATAAAATLSGEGIEADVIDLVSLAPLDRELLRARVRETGRLVVVHPQDPALARHVQQIALEEAFLYLEAPLGEAGATEPEITTTARTTTTY